MGMLLGILAQMGPPQMQGVGASQILQNVGKILRMINTVGVTQPQPDRVSPSSLGGAPGISPADIVARMQQVQQSLPVAQMAAQQAMGAMRGQPPGGPGMMPPGGMGGR